MSNSCTLVAKRWRWIASVILIIFLASSFVFAPLVKAAQLVGPIKKKVVIASGGSEITSFYNAYEQAQLMLKEALPEGEGINYQLILFTAKNLEELATVAELAKEAKDADVILLDRISNYNLPQIIDALKKANLPSTVSIVAPRMSDTDLDVLEPNLKERFKGYGRGVVNTPNVMEMRDYLDNDTPENMAGLQLYLLADYGGVPINAPGLIMPLQEFAYHPDAPEEQDRVFADRSAYIAWYKQVGKYKQDASWIGIAGNTSYYYAEDTAIYDALINSLEGKGFNVVQIFGNKDSLAKFFVGEGSLQVDLIINSMVFSLTPEEFYQEVNVPVMNPIYFRHGDEWRASKEGLGQEQWWQVVAPEITGRIDSILIGGTEELYGDPVTGAVIEKRLPIADRVERVVGRAEKWLALQQKSNEEKKVAIIYYNSHGGKGDISASYLNVEKSLDVLLEALKNDGYEAGEEDLSQDLLGQILEKGVNIGSWAPGAFEELVKTGVVTVDKEEYLSWYQELDQALRQEVEAEWGLPPGDIMVHEDKIVVPGLMLGNIFIGPQPRRAVGDDPGKLAHSATLPPTHQYLAFYFWLQKGWESDAVIHLGTHGSLEFTPGRAVGLGGDDWPDVLIGNLPNIYPYIMDNVAEAMIAKRRGYAVTISHQTPPIINAMYGELVELEQWVEEHDDSATDEVRREALEVVIRKQVAELGLEKILKLDLGREAIAVINDTLMSYFETLKQGQMPYGMHTLGVPPEEGVLQEMVAAMQQFNQDADPAVLEEMLRNADAEITNLLRALRGEYIEVSPGGDPIRKTGVLPTGRNLIAVDPNTLPDKAAWEIGKIAADQLLDNYRQEHGHYPESVATVVWSYETMSSNGQSVAMILRLLGAEPRWDGGKVVGYDFLSLEELGRPRVDVLITISGLFRDSFPNLVALLDDACRDAALLEESPDQNYIVKGYGIRKSKLQEQGLTEDDAAFFAGGRLFGPPLGGTGTGVPDMVQNPSAWEDTGDLANQYLNNMSYMYGRKSEGVAARHMIEASLENVDTTVKVMDNYRGVLDSHVHVYEYVGGLTAAAQYISGREIDTYIANTASGQAQVQSFNQYLADEVTTRLLNPVWTQAMLDEGYAGSNLISNQIGVAFGIDATLGDVEDQLWKSIADTYAFNDQIWEQLDPSARQMIAAWMLDAIRRDMWQADPEDIERMANRYVENVAEYGNNCCQVTSDQKLNTWIAYKATVNKNILDRFKDNFFKATKQRLDSSQVTVTLNVNRQQAINQSSSPRALLPEPIRPLEEIKDTEEPKEMPEPPKQIVAKELELEKPETIPIFWAGSIATFAVAFLIAGMGFRRQWKKGDKIKHRFH